MRGPLFLPELRHIPPPGTPLMITSQHPPRIVIQTPKNDLGTAVLVSLGHAMTDFADELGRLLAERGMSQRELARRANYDAGRINKICRAPNRPRRSWPRA